MQKHPGEIIILDILNDINPQGMVGHLVPQSTIDSLVKEYIDEKFLLTRDYLEKPISEYGGIYITGSN